MSQRFKIKVIIPLVITITAIIILSIFLYNKRKIPKNKFFTYDHVVLIGIDGAGHSFEDASVSNFNKIFENGAISYHVLTSEPTISAQCWGSMLTGVAPEIHKLTNSKIENTPYDVNSDYPTVFRIIRENNPKAGLASFVSWQPINTGIIEDNIDVNKQSGTDEEIKNMVCIFRTNRSRRFRSLITELKISLALPVISL